MIFLVIVFAFLLVVMIVQMMRYSEDQYSCRHMARDQEEYLEGLGLNVLIARADNIFGTEQGHVWIAIDFGGIILHFDSVSLLPIIPPENAEYFDSYEEYLKK